MLSTDIARQLQAIRTSVAGLEDATLVNFDGKIVATTQADAKAVERVATMSMALLAMGEQSTISLQRGELIEAYVRTASATLVLIPLPIGALLAARVRLGVPLGLVLLELRRLAEAIVPHEEEAVLETEPPVEVEPPPDTSCVEKEGAISEMGIWMIECLVRGLLHLYKVAYPPVPIEIMLERPYPAFATAAKQQKKRKELAAVEDATERRWIRARDLYFRIYYNEESVEMMEKFDLVGSDAEAEHFAGCLLLPEEWLRLAAGKVKRVTTMVRAFNAPQDKIAARLVELGCSGQRLT